MTKTVFVVYKDEILHRGTKMKRNLKIGEYDTPEESRAAAREYLMNIPNDQLYNIELRVEKEERIIEQGKGKPAL